MTEKQKKCSGAHCRCMNLGGQCPNIHPSECIEHCPELVAKMKHNTTTEEKCDHVYRTLENINGISGKTTYDKRCMFCGEVAHTPDSIGWHKTIEGKVENALGNVNVEIVELIKSEKALSRAEGWTDAIRAVFSGDTVELDGKFYKLSNPDIYNYLSSLTPKEDKL